MRSTRRREVATNAIVLIALASCHHGASTSTAPSSRTAAEARCFQEGVPPPWHWPHDPHELIDGLGGPQNSDPACPLDLPAEHSACTLPAEAACYYVSFSAPCDPTAATCENGAVVLARIQF
jgi:hypothetical protein